MTSSSSGTSRDESGATSQEPSTVVSGFANHNSVSMWKVAARTATFVGVFFAIATLALIPVYLETQARHVLEVEDFQFVQKERRVPKGTNAGPCLSAAPQLPFDRSVSLLADFGGFALAYLVRPVVKAFFKIDEAFWNGSLNVEGLEASVQILRDSNGVPYVYASHQDDLCLAQGFLHAIERPFQIELLRLLAEGRSAEVLGPQMADVDLISRTMISEETLVWKLRRLDPKDKSCLVAYTRGLSAAFASLPTRPLEFVLLRHSPKTQFSLLDVCAMTVLIAMMLNRGLTGDYVKHRIKTALKDKAQLFDFGFPSEVPLLNAENDGPSVRDQRGNLVSPPLEPLPSDEWSKRNPLDFPEMTLPPLKEEEGFGANLHDRDTAPSLSPEKMKLFHDQLAEGGSSDQRDESHAAKNLTSKYAVRLDGSNAWAVSGKFTLSGKPLLAGDPHMELTAPGFWMPMGLFSDGAKDGVKVRAIGASAVGVHGIFVGHNEFAAWSQTVAHTDIEDFYLVETNSDGTEYLYEERFYPLKFIDHKIWVKGRSSPITRLTRYCHVGPLISDAIPELQKGLKPNQALAVASVALRAPLPTSWVKTMLTAKNWKDFFKLGSLTQMSEFVTVWATREGDIGASVGGAIPRRPYLKERPLRRASRKSENWNGVLPPSSIPSVVNPVEGFVVAGNSRLSPDPLRQLGEVFVPGHRVRRAVDLLSQLIVRGKVTVEDLEAMQEDQHSLNGCEFKDFVLKHVLRPSGSSGDKGQIEAFKVEGLTRGDSDLVFKILSSWDCRLDADSVGASLYEVWIQMTLQEVFLANGWSEETLLLLLGGGIHPTWMPRTEALNHWRGNLLQALKVEDSRSLLLPPGESVESVLKKALSKTLSFLRNRLGAPGADKSASSEDTSQVERNPSLSVWRWGRLRTRFVDHVFAKNAAFLRQLLGAGPFAWGGNFGTLKAHHFEPHILKPENPSSANFDKGIDTTSFRVVVDLADFSKSKWSFLPGVSGWQGSPHFANRAHVIKDGGEEMLPMPWSDEEIQASAVSKLTLHSTSPNQPSAHSFGKEEEL